MSDETHLKVQRRLKENAYARTRTRLSQDFILQGNVARTCCGNAIAGSWSTGRGGKTHSSVHRTSIKRDAMENAFADLLQKLEPSRQLITFPRRMFPRHLGAADGAGRRHTHTA
ncbi:MAG: hypothetical protein AAF608_06080 [Pseudomonadota bacterium]